MDWAEWWARSLAKWMLFLLRAGVRKAILLGNYSHITTYQWNRSMLTRWVNIKTVPEWLSQLQQRAMSFFNYLVSSPLLTISIHMELAIKVQTINTWNLSRTCWSLNECRSRTRGYLVLNHKSTHHFGQALHITSDQWVLARAQVPPPSIYTTDPVTDT